MRLRDPKSALRQIGWSSCRAKIKSLMVLRHSLSLVLWSVRPMHLVLN
jgi:hypothetical protein